MLREIALTREPQGEIDTTAVGVFSDRLDDEGVELDWAFLAGTGFAADVGETVAIPGEDGQPRLVVGLGSAEKLDADVLRTAAGATAGALRRHRRVAVTFLQALTDGVERRRAAQAIAEGLVLGSYRYTALKSQPETASPEASSLEEVVVLGTGGKRVQAALDRGVAVAEAVALARDLVNEPGGSLTPRAFAHRVLEMGEARGLSVNVLDAVDIEAARLGGLLGVNRGSTEPPRFVQITYEPANPRGSVALVGKGITFDSGGLSLKPTEGMATMKDDMGGAAAVVGAMSALPAVGPRPRVTAYLPLTDNMPGPDATRVGDVLTIRDGTTVEVLNTDAEGRLVLADALSMASEDEPDVIIDLATLTGACVVALGNETAGLMGNHRGLVDAVREAGERCGESLWPLPLSETYRKALESKVGDIKNITSDRAGGALVAGVFLSHFVGEGIPWAHIDIAGPAWSRSGDHLTPEGGTGFGVRTLVEFLSSYSRPKPAEA